MIKKNEISLFVNRVTKVFIDFLEKKGVIIPENREENSQDFSNVDWFRGCDTADSVDRTNDDSVQDLFQDLFLGPKSLNPVDELKRDLENFFRNYGVLEDSRCLVEYLFTVFINDVKCEGVIKVKASDPDEALVKAQELVSNKLFESFPSLDIKYDVEPIEEEGYPLFKIEAMKLPFSEEADITIPTSDKTQLYQLFDKVCKDKKYVKAYVSVQTSSGASPTILGMKMTDTIW